MPAVGPIPVARTSLRIIVVGYRATCKSNLIAAAAAETFRQDVPPVLPPTRLPADYYPDNVPIIIIIHTSSSLENSGRLAEELKRADLGLSFVFSNCGLDAISGPLEKKNSCTIGSWGGAQEDCLHSRPNSTDF